MPDEGMNKRTIDEVMSVYVLPEVHRRRQGMEAEPYALRAAQVVFFPDGRKPEVRLNDEVRGRASVKLKEGSPMSVGSPVYASQVEEVTGFVLRESDCAHITLLSYGGTLYGFFDAHYGRGVAHQHSKTALQFIEAAEIALGKGHTAVFVDVLFTAAELLAKALLFALPEPFRAKVKKGTHNDIRQKMKWYEVSGGCEPRYRKALNKLSGLRDSLRYLKGGPDLTTEEADEYLSVVKAMAADSRQIYRELGDDDAELRTGETRGN